MKKYFVLLLPIFQIIRNYQKAILLFFVILEVACSDSHVLPRTFVQGTVVSFYDSSVVVPRAKVYLHEGQDRFLIDSIISDNLGKYRMDFTPKENTWYGVTAKQERYFESSKNYFFFNDANAKANNLLIAAYPKSFIRVRVRDTSLSNIGYVGVRLNHTAYADYKLVYGYPLKDTTVIVEGNHQGDAFIWGFLYPNNWGFPYKVIKFKPATPLDTFNLEIKF